MKRAGILSARQKAIARCAKSRHTPARCTTTSAADVLGFELPIWYWICSRIHRQSYDPGIPWRHGAEFPLRHAHQNIRLAIAAGKYEWNGFHRQHRNRRFLDQRRIIHQVIQPCRRAVGYFQRARKSADAYETVVEYGVGKPLVFKRGIERKRFVNDPLVLVCGRLYVEDKVAGLENVVVNFAIDPDAYHALESRAKRADDL